MKNVAALCVWACLLGAARGDEPYSLNRGWARVRPFAGVRAAGFSGEDVTMPAGAIADLGVDAETRSGFLIGVEIAPLTIMAARPQISARLHLGYANEKLAIGVGVGSGFTSQYAQVGPLVRLGRHDRTHANLRISFSVYPPQPIPSDLDLEVVVPVHQRVRLDINLGGGYGTVIGLYGTVGTQVLVASKGPRNQTRLNVGIGVSWVQYALGPAALVGIDQVF